MEGKRTTPLKAIRLKCLDCCCGSAHEVKLCDVVKCALHPYRFGKNPSRAGIGNRNALGVKNNVSANDFRTNDSGCITYPP